MSKFKNDLPDSEADKTHLQPDTANIDLPDVKDIPGQEHVHVLPLGELADTTISSDDEEGKGLFDEDDESDVSEEEKELLQETSESMASRDDMALKRSKLDEIDLDGVMLNEKEDVGGDDLDVPGDELDDLNEAIGEEDEENNSYSLGGENHDD